MRNVSWAVYVTALLIGSSFAIVSEATVESAAKGLAAPGCSIVGCLKCRETTCALGPGEYTVFNSTTTEKRCVEYDGTPPAHCAWFTVTNLDIYGMDGYPVGTCATIPCPPPGGTPIPTEVCNDPWP